MTTTSGFTYVLFEHVICSFLFSMDLDVDSLMSPLLSNIAVGTGASSCFNTYFKSIDLDDRNHITRPYINSVSYTVFEPHFTPFLVTAIVTTLLDNVALKP